MCVIRYFRTSVGSARPRDVAWVRSASSFSASVSACSGTRPHADACGHPHASPCQLRRRRARTGEQHRLARRPDVVLQYEQLLLQFGDVAVDIVGDIDPHVRIKAHIARLRVDPEARRAGGHRAQQMTATTALRAPEQHEALAAAIDERAQRGNRFGVSADDEVVELGAQRLDEVEGQLARAVVHRWRSRRSAARLQSRPGLPCAASGKSTRAKAAHRP